MVSWRSQVGSHRRWGPLMEKAVAAKAWGSPKRKEDGIFYNGLLGLSLTFSRTFHCTWHRISAALTSWNSAFSFPCYLYPGASASFFGQKCLFTSPSAWDTLPQAAGFPTSLALILPLQQVLFTPSLSLPCATFNRHISTGFCFLFPFRY